MSKNINHLQHIKSNVVENGQPKLPGSNVLVDGELAVNYAKGVETISLRNSNNEVVRFSSDNYYTEQKLGSGFTGENSANTVTKVIEENELAISAALNNLNSRKMDVSAYTPTDLSNYYSKTEIDNKLGTGFTSSSITEVIEENEEIVSAALNELDTNKLDVSAYTPTDLSNYYTKSETSGSTQLTTAFNNKANTATTIAGYGITDAKIANQVITLGSNNITVSSSTQVQTALNAKANTSALNGYADSVKYNSANSTIEFYHGGTGGTKVFELDATAFIKDGMVSNVEISNGNLVITFNSDAGKTPISIPLADIFDPSNYYNKTEIDNKLGTGFTLSSVTDVIEENELAISAALNDLNKRMISSVAEVNDHVSNSDIHIKSGGQVIYNLTNVSGTPGDTNLCASWSGDCEGITDLYDGLNIQLKLPVSGHATGCTISINGGEKHKCILNASTSLNTQYPKDSVLQFVYDANQSATIYTGSSTTQTVQGVWKIANYDSNSNTIGYNVGANQVAYKVDAATYIYMLLLTKDETTLTPINSVSGVTAGTKTLTTSEFDPFGGIYYKSSTTTVSNGGTLATGTVWTQYSVNLAYSFNTTNTLVSQKAVYIVAVPQTNGKAKLHTNPITQTLPTSDDGLIYIFLGNAYSNTSIYLEINHPVYIYKNGKVRPYTMCSDAAYMDVESALTPSSSASTNLVTAKAVLEVINDKVNTTDFNNKLGTGFTLSSITEVIEDDEKVIASALNDLNAKKLDVSAYTPTDLSNYYTKAETSGKTEISTALSNKVDTSAFTAHTGNTSIHHTHSNKTYLDNITGNVGTMAYQNASSYSSATQVNTALNGKANSNHNQASNTITAMTGYVSGTTGGNVATGDTLNQAIGKLECNMAALTPDAELSIATSASTNPIQTQAVFKVIKDNEEIIAAALNDLRALISDLESRIETLENYHRE